MGMGGGKGGGSTIDFDPTQSATQANKILDDVLKSSIPYYGALNEKAMNAARMGAEQSTNTLREFYDRSRADVAPYQQAGYEALDMYQDSLGMRRPGVGSAAIAQAAQAEALKNAAMTQRQQAASRLTSQMGVSPTEQLYRTNALTHGTNLPGQLSMLQRMQMPQQQQAPNGQGSFAGFMPPQANPLAQYTQAAIATQPMLNQAQMMSNPSALAALRGMSAPRGIR